jgi:hypothetical protein
MLLLKNVLRIFDINRYIIRAYDCASYILGCIKLKLVTKFDLNQIHSFGVNREHTSLQEIIIN